MDPIVEQAKQANSNTSILLQFHPSPSGDIFYQLEMASRLNFYPSIGLPFTGYPTCYVDGLREPPWVYSVSNITNEINNRLAVDTPISISTELSAGTAKLNQTNSAINYSTNVSSESVIASNNLKLIAFVTESAINHSAPNGLQIHNHIVRDIVPDENGIAVDLSNANNLLQVFEGSIDVTLTNELANHSMVFVVQDFGTGEVYQAVEANFDQYLDTEDEITGSPADFSLDNVYPNPFNPVTNISFSIKDNSPISLEVYSLSGKKIATIVDNEMFQQGNHTAQWNAAGHPSGTYFFKLSSANGIKIKKAILLK